MNTPCISCNRLTQNRRGERGAVRCDDCKRAYEIVRSQQPKRRAYNDPRYRQYPVEGRLCWICHELIGKGQGTRDHVVPLSRGGTNEWSNLRPAHRRCNSGRGNGMMED